MFSIHFDNVEIAIHSPQQLYPNLSIKPEPITNSIKSHLPV